ncbi:MAG: Fic family protein, partial [Bacteroidota bacterium]
FLEVLRYRHQSVMRSRPQKLPGQFKIHANRAGNTFFVSPKEVIGTLEAGFEVLASLPDPLARALYMMFLISEVHPFEDGNGRVARLMMNAELTAAGQTKIIIPTVYRDDYLLNLRRLTRQHDTKAYIRMMDRAHAFSHWLEPDNYPALKAQLERSNAFEEEGKVLQF